METETGPNFIRSTAQHLNIPEETVRAGLGVILKFIKEKAGGTQFASLAKLVPDADELIAKVPSADAGGLLGGLLGKAGGLFGGAGDLAGVVASLQAAGIPLDKAAPLAADLLAKAREVLGDETVDAIVAQVPILGTLAPKAAPAKE